MEERADATFDVVVVGGGAAGLAGALALARARRSVLVVDAAEPRNAPAGHVHNYLGLEGTPPGELLAAGRAEVTGYGGQIVAGTVASAAPDGPGFRVLLDGGRAVRSRRLLVATGLVDELPDVPGLAQRWGRDVLHCPYCHGYEVRDRPLGVLATGPMAMHQALLFRQWSDDVTVLLHTAYRPTGDELEQLAARGIAVVAGPVAALEIADDELTGVRLGTGEVVRCRALVVAPRFTARAAVLAALGLDTVEQHMGPHVVGTAVPADASGATAVPGVWVAGNVADLRAQVIGAAAGGLTAAAAINADLVAEDTRNAVAAHRAHRHRHAEGEHGEMFTERFWEQRYRCAPAVWSRQPNAQLVAEAADLAPGTALDAGCGEGADTVWLAERGWQVTALDVAATALERGTARAGAEIADRIRWVQADLTAWTPPEGLFDLVSAQFVHPPGAARAALLARLAAAVAPGGDLLVVGHHPADLQTTMPRVPEPGVYATAEELAKTLDPDDWDVLVTDARPRSTTDPEGRAVTGHDAVLRARRRR